MDSSKVSIYVSKRLTYQEAELEIEPVIEAKLRKLTENAHEKIAQSP